MEKLGEMTEVGICWGREKLWQLYNWRRRIGRSAPDSKEAGFISEGRREDSLRKRGSVIGINTWAEMEVYMLIILPAAVDFCRRTCFVIEWIKVVKGEAVLAFCLLRSRLSLSISLFHSEAPLALRFERFFK